MVVLAACASGSGRPAVTAVSAAPSGTRATPGSAPPDLTGIGGQPVGLAFAYGSVWVTAAGSNEVMRIEPATGDIVGQVRVGDTPLRLVATPHGIWVSEFRAGTVALLDAAGTVAARVPVGAQPEGLATDGTHLWVVLQKDSQLVELDAATGSTLGTVLLPSGGEPRLAAYAPAAPGRPATVWVTDFGGDRLVPVDAADGRVETAVAACPGHR